MKRIKHTEGPPERPGRCPAASSLCLCGSAWAGASGLGSWQQCGRSWPPATLKGHRATCRRRGTNQQNWRQKVPPRACATCTSCPFWTTRGREAHTYHLPSAFVLLLELQVGGHLQGTRTTEWSQARRPAAGPESPAAGETRGVLASHLPWVWARSVLSVDATAVPRGALGSSRPARLSTDGLKPPIARQGASDSVDGTETCYVSGLRSRCCFV